MKLSISGVPFRDTRWNVFAIHEWRIVWMLMPKTASSAIRHELAKCLNLPTENVHAITRFSGLSTADVWRLKQDGYYVIGTVRNPVKRLTLCWFDKVVNKPFYKEFETFEDLHPDMSFDEFVKAVAQIPDEDAEPHFRSLAFSLTLEGELLPDLILRQEHLKRDWKRCRSEVKRFTNGAINLDPLILRNDSSWRQSLMRVSPETRRLIRQRYAKDFELFNYRPNVSINVATAAASYVEAYARNLRAKFK